MYVLDCRTIEEHASSTFMRSAVAYFYIEWDVCIYTYVLKGWFGLDDGAYGPSECYPCDPCRVYGLVPTERMSRSSFLFYLAGIHACMCSVLVRAVGWSHMTILPPHTRTTPRARAYLTQSRLIGKTSS